MKALREHFGKRLKAAIQAAGSTQAKFAEDLDVATSTVSQWVRGVCFPEDSREDQIYKALNIDEAYFTGHISTPPITSAQVAEIQKALSKTSSSEILTRISNLESELSRKDEEIRKLKEKIKRLSQPEPAVDVDANSPEFRAMMDRMEKLINDPTIDASAVVEEIFPSRDNKTKERKGAG